MTQQIKLRLETKSNLDTIEQDQKIFFKSYDQKVAFLYQFYKNHSHLVK